MTQYYYDEINLGTTVELTKHFNDEDVSNYALLTKDQNPIHIDEAYARKSIFKRRVVHGQLAAGTFSMMFGTKCPGIGAIYCSQNTTFTAPIYLDEDIKFRIKVIEKNDEKAKITFETNAYKGDVLAIKGIAILKVQRRI